MTGVHPVRGTTWSGHSTLTRLSYHECWNFSKIFLPPTEQVI